MGYSHIQKIGEHSWIYPCDAVKDRPNLGYIEGTNMALAVDAGHSSSHVMDFYDALEKEMLPLPDITVITHWHWDHTFGMHAVHGKTMARPETNTQLKRIQQEMRDDQGYAKRFINSDVCIRREYAGGVPLKVVSAQEEVTENICIDLGGVHAQICYAESPHTEDALLIYVPEDRVVYIGDAQLGEFPSWRMNFRRLEALEQQIRALDVRTVIDGHWKPYSKKAFLAEL